MHRGRFRGRFYHALDSKGRVSVPSAFRPRLLVYRQRLDESGNAVESDEVDADQPPILVSYQDYLRLYRHDDWEVFEQEITSVSEVDAETEEFSRYVVSSAVEAAIDKQGRISIPQFQRDEAELGKDVVVNGHGGWVEIWNREHFEARLRKTGARFADLKSGLAQKVGKVR